MNRQTSLSLLIFLAVISGVRGFAQIDARVSAKGALAAMWAENLYVRSLSACVEASTAENPGRTEFVVVQNSVFGDLDPVQVLPTMLASTAIQYLDNNALIKRYQRLRHQFAVWAIKPVNNDREESIVNCAQYSASVHKRKLVLGVYGGYLVRWHYDTASKEFVRVGVERWKWSVD